jgi:hypothetical protein
MRLGECAGLEDEEDTLRADLNPSELDFLARISGARVDNRPFRQEEHPAVTHSAVIHSAVTSQLSLANCYNGQRLLNICHLPAVTQQLP